MGHHLPYNFWSEVEKPMKHVLYGDSIGSQQFVLMKHKKHTANATFENIWKFLTEQLNRDVIGDDFGKERIFDLEDIQIQTYFEQEDVIKWVTPKYIMRHHIKDEVVRLNMNNSKSLVCTKKHSMFTYDGCKFQIEDAVNMTYLPSIYTHGQEGVAYCENVGIVFNHTSHKFKKAVTPIKVSSKEFIRYDDYVFDFEVENTHNFVVDGFVVHNTDSIFINIPLEEDQDKSVEALVSISGNIANEINDNIKRTNDGYILPKLGADPARSETFFKTELVGDSIMFLDIKKNYAYRMLADNGKILEDPEFVYKGIPVVRTNVAYLSKQLIRKLVEEIALNPDMDQTQINKKIAEVASWLWKETQDCINNNQFDKFATPSKWAGTDYKKPPFNVISMKMYNALAQDDVFKPLTSGLIFPAKVNTSKLSMAITEASRNPSRTKLWMDAMGLSSDIKHFCIPHEYNPKVVRELMKKGGITIDPKEVYSSMYGKVAQRIKDTIIGSILQS